MSDPATIPAATLLTRLRRIPAHALIAVTITLILLTALTLRFLGNPLWTPILLTGTILCALPLFSSLIRQILHGNFSVDILALLSVSTGLLMHQYWVAALVILMLSGGQTLEEFATGKASSVLSALAKRMPQTAHLAAEGESTTRDLPIAEVEIGSHILVYPHEICPIDGILLSGSGSMDESYLTGEPFAIAKAPGSTVLSGAINGPTLLRIRATSRASDSRYAQIVAVLHQSEQSRPRMRRLGDRLGGWYTPVAVALAGLAWLLSGHAERFLAVLVIATPCPLLIAIPVAIISAISVAARRGIVIKDAAVLEKIATCTSLIVDKTGTLTYGRPQLTLLACDPAERAILLQLIASVEMYSRHPLARAILDAAQAENIPLLEATAVSETPGTGLHGTVAGHSLWITGRGKLTPALAATLPPTGPGLECVAVLDNTSAALLQFQDEPRADTAPFLTHLGPRHNIAQVTLLSGDRLSEVQHFAQRMKIENVYGGMSPEQKVDVVRKLTAHAQTIYIGDGINDAPAMLNATVGIALGVNSEITSEAAGAVILESSLRGVDELIHIGARMRRIALQSALGGMALSIAGMAAAGFGLISPIEGALLQEAIDLAAILNSLRMILPQRQISDFQSAT